MSGKEKEVLAKAALGRPFQLGMLYDCRSDKIVPGIMLWKDQDVALSEEPNSDMTMHSSSYEVATEDNLNAKSLYLNLDSNLTLSVLGGLVDASGSAKFLFDKAKSSRQARVSLVYKCTTKFEKLSKDIFIKDGIHKEVFQKKLATHVVTGILYGVDVLFVFDRTLQKNESALETKASLQADVSKIPQLALGGGAAAEIERMRRENEKNISCTFYGDIVLDKNPKNFGDAFDVYQQLAGIIKVGEPDERSVPKKVWLTPLSVLDDDAARLVREISVYIVNRAETLLDEFHDVKAEASDLQNCINELDFAGNIPGQLTRFTQMVNEHITKFSSRLMSLLPEIRGDPEQKEAALANLLDEVNTHPFNTEEMKGWLQEKEAEAETLSHLLGKLTSVEGVELTVGSAAFSKVLIDNNSKTLLSFDFDIPHIEPLLEEMNAHLQSTDYVKSVKTYWHNDPCMVRTICNKVDQFVSFAKANSNSNYVKFVVTCNRVEKAPDKLATITLHSTNETMEEYDIPTAPGKPRVVNVLDTVNLKWDPPSHGAKYIKSYCITYFSDQAKIKRLTVDDTSAKIPTSEFVPNENYTFIVHGESELGVTGSSKFQFKRPGVTE